MLPPEARKPKAKKVARKVKPAPPPNFPKKVPVRPGARTNRYVSKPTTQAQRTHVHKSRVDRNSLLAAAERGRAQIGLEAAAHENLKHPEKLKPIKKKEHHGALVAAATGAAQLGSKAGSAAVSGASKAAPYVAAAAMPAITAAAAATDKLTGSKVIPTLKKTAENVPIDAAELVTTTPTSVAKLGSTAVHDPKKLPGLLAQPYKDFAKDPIKFATEHPVTTGLMLSPAVKVPGRIVGRGARLAGKQTLARAPATLPGTALKETRVGSRGALTNALQKRKDAKAGPQTMTDKQVERRVDAFYGTTERNQQRVRGEVTQSEKRAAKSLPKAERGPQVDERVTGAVKQARGKAEERFAEEFGSTWHVNPEGRIVKPTDATKGVLHADKAHADAIADRLPFDAVVKPVGDKFAVLPKSAAEQLRHHESVGSSRSTGSKVLRASRAAFARTVLPTRIGWLTGQATEAGLRTALNRAGPRSAKLTKRVVAEMERQEPGSGKMFLDRTIGQGNVSRTAREMLSPEARAKTLGQEFEGTPLHGAAKALTQMGKAPVAKQTRQAWRVATDFVFNTANGKYIEGKTQNAMLGRALRESPLLHRRILTVSDKAVKEAAEGLKDTAAQHQLAVDVQRAYGKYSNFNPHAREAILHWTPFIPWYINSVKFLASVLPKDHPVVTAALADATAATEEWRKKQGLSLRGGKTKPPWMLGNYPTKKGLVKVGHYTPFGIGQGRPSENISGLVLPQFSSASGNFIGRDWTGKELKKGGKYGRPFNEPERFLAAGSGLAEAMIPGVAQAGQLTGVIPKYVYGKDVPVGMPTAKQLRKQINPLEPITSGEKPKKKVRKRKAPGGPPLGGGGSRSGPPLG